MLSNTGFKMLSLIKKCLYLIALMTALSFMPYPRSSTSLATLETENIISFCGGGEKAYETALLSLKRAILWGSEFRLPDLVGLGEIKKIAFLRLCALFKIYGLSLLTLTAAAYLAFRYLMLKRLFNLRGTRELRFIIFKTRPLCMWLMLFFILENAFPSFDLIAPLFLLLLVLYAASAAIYGTYDRI